MYSRRNESFGKIYKFQLYESKQCMNFTALGFAPGPSLNLSERQPIRSDHDDNNHQWQQLLNGQHTQMSVNGASIMYVVLGIVIKK